MPEELPTPEKSVKQIEKELDRKKFIIDKNEEWDYEDFILHPQWLALVRGFLVGVFYEYDSMRIDGERLILKA